MNKITYYGQCLCVVLHKVHDENIARGALIKYLTHSYWNCTRENYRLENILFYLIQLNCVLCVFTIVINDFVYARRTSMCSCMNFKQFKMKNTGYCLLKICVCEFSFAGKSIYFPVCNAPEPKCIVVSFDGAIYMF